ncbi:type II toxin-antitoxin system HipA family toxin [Chromohalobacter sp. HP20-39]|uniref:type II toxin-antitoxin system HipA family toxin n=1 Tax=Chromohalobacter sp. HP20-39 TaxID=3079306 RepID=UPI00294B0364|nr:HipA domain-containing protein [Chromohalobacter sp. HP20-39]MDV6318502.1 HipA domain-containing protein [Chromohalobacter sp. HP20-39]
MTLTLQIFHQHRWHDAAILSIPYPEKGRRGPASLGYEQYYAVDWMECDDERACGVNYPVRLMEQFHGAHWFAFLDDLMPAGASRRYWIQQLGIDHLPPGEQDFELLRHGTIAPVGNLRIREAVPPQVSDGPLTQIRFPAQDVIERHTDFLEYAQQMGAASGGATGAGGEAPKLLLRCSPENRVWIDTWQDEQTLQDQHYLVKFPRNRRDGIDCDILRAEYYFYHELAALGMETIDTTGMRLEEGARYPSLWLPRFDVAFEAGQRTLYGLESVYSIMEKGPGAYLSMLEVIDTLVARLSRQSRVQTEGATFDAASLVIELVKRDLLNVAFGNSDNHGRNTAIIKRPDGMTLAPIYDFAPMKADPEGVTRTTTWGTPLEAGGYFDWYAIAKALSAYVPEEQLIAELRTLAQKLLGLHERLAQRGVPRTILDFPSIGFARLDERLHRWNLV